MQIEIRGHLKATEAIRQHVERRMRSALGRFDQRVRAVTIRLEDINGPAKGGADKACQIEITLAGPRRPPMVIEEVHADLYLAVSYAAERVSQVVRREIDRLHHARLRSSAIAS